MAFQKVKWGGLDSAEENIFAAERLQIPVLNGKHIYKEGQSRNHSLFVSIIKGKRTISTTYQNRKIYLMAIRDYKYFCYKQAYCLRSGNVLSVNNSLMPNILFPCFIYFASRRTVLCIRWWVTNCSRVVGNPGTSPLHWSGQPEPAQAAALPGESKNTLTGFSFILTLKYFRKVA